MYQQGRFVVVNTDFDRTSEKLDVELLHELEGARTPIPTRLLVSRDSLTMRVAGAIAMLGLAFGGNARPMSHHAAR